MSGWCEACGGVVVSVRVQVSVFVRVLPCCAHLESHAAADGQRLAVY